MAREWKSQTSELIVFSNMVGKLTKKITFFLAVSRLLEEETKYIKKNKAPALSP